MINIHRLSEADLESIRHLIPGPDPALIPNPTTGQVIPVANTKLDGNELPYLTECIRSNWISSVGPFVAEFERKFAQAVDCEYGVACCNGTVALHLAMATLGIGPGDEVIIPTFTMIATANAVAYTGATPILVDAEPDTWNIDPAQIEARITQRTRAIIVVHTYGHPVQIEVIAEIARRHGLHLIEDAAEAHGAEYDGRRVGSLGQVATFSFYANKIITTGEGGMLTTNDPELAAVARRLRDHAFSPERHFWHEYRGFNYRMTNLQAAVGLAQTERLAEIVESRRTNARLYTERLRGLPGLSLPREMAPARSVCWMYGMLVEEDFGCTRDELRRHLADVGIETRTFFIPIHFQPIYFEQFRGERFPIAERLCQRGLYLPSGSSLTLTEIETVTRAVAAATQQSNSRPRWSGPGSGDEERNRATK